jgi:hypothetical protein
VEFRLFGVFRLFSGGSKYTLHCQHCEYEVYVDGEDIQIAKALVAQSELYRAGVISQEEDVEYVANNTPDCVAALVASSTDRVCPECGETVPATFVNCWHCNAELEPVAGCSPVVSGDEPIVPEPEESPAPFGGMQLRFPARERTPSDDQTREA